jgi:hypothetical protein
MSARTSDLCRVKVFQRVSLTWAFVSRVLAIDEDVHTFSRGPSERGRIHVQLHPRCIELMSQQFRHISQHSTPRNSAQASL